jgi:hypothetical protein
MSVRVHQHSLSKGEISPRLYGRTDVAGWASAVKRALNVVILKEGGMTQRPGMEFVGPVYDQDRAPRLVPFQFGMEQSYALELGQGYLRVAALGGLVLEPEYAVTFISNANPCVVTLPFHPYAAGDEVFFSGIEGMVQINNSTFRVLNVLSDSTFTINADSRDWGAFTGATGGTLLTEALEPPPPPVVPNPTPQPPPPPPVWDWGLGGGGWYFGGFF